MLNFKPDCKAVLIGSLPMDDHEEALRLMLNHTPEVPLWIQLPRHPEEGMLNQFLPGMPGLTREHDRVYIDADTPRFDQEMIQFYEDYIAVTEGAAGLETSRFALTEETARGFFCFLSAVRKLPHPPGALKGQITGPVTMGIGIKDRNGKAVFYDDRIRDILTRNLAMKARWQAHQLTRLGAPGIIFFDEPGLASFGSSAYISISREQIQTALAEMVAGVHAGGGLAGIHICANADWSLALDSEMDIISFDAYSFFDRFILFPEQLKKYLLSGRILAWGIVPTSNPEDIAGETVQSLTARWHEQADRVAALGIAKPRLMAQSLITPSCGTGSLSLQDATRVLELTRGVSEQLRRDTA